MQNVKCIMQNGRLVTVGTTIKTKIECNLQDARGEMKEMKLPKKRKHFGAIIAPKSKK